MLTSLRVANFKSWNTLGPIRLAPITVFFGTNSSGKTSISQSLLLLKQTAISPDRKRVIHFGDRNSLVDVGTYQDMVFEHDERRSVEFELSWSLPSEMVVRDTRTQRSYKGSELQFATRVVPPAEQRGRVVVDSFNYTLRNGETALEVGMRRSTGNKYDLFAEGYTPVRTKGRVWPLPEPVRFYGFPDEAVAYFDNTGFLPDFTLQLERQLGRIAYLGPLRQKPERSYIWSGEVPEHVGWSGERAIEAMLAAKGRKISPGYKRKARSFDTVVAGWLKEMGVISDFAVRQVSRNRKDYEVRVRTTPHSPEVVLPDVGFGVSQVLPVVVQCYYAEPNTSIIMEQPEIHLHPSVQAALADLFAEAVRARENGADRNIQVLIESHSEHFLRRLQRLIAEEKLQPDDVAVYFADHGDQGSSLEELRVDLFGRIANWPDKFFGDMPGEVAAQTKIMLQRLSKGNVKAS